MGLRCDFENKAIGEPLNAAAHPAFSRMKPDGRSTTSASKTESRQLSFSSPVDDSAAF